MIGLMTNFLKLKVAPYHKVEMKLSPVEMWWHTVTHGRGRVGETGKCSG